MLLEWLQSNTEGRYSSANTFEAAKILKNHLKNFSIWADFLKMTGMICDFRNAPSNTTVLTNLHALANMLARFDDAWGRELIGLAFLEASKFVFPVRQPKKLKPDESRLISAVATSRLPQLIFHKFRPEMFKWCLADMSSSAVCKQKDKKPDTPCDGDKENDAPDTPLPKRQKKTAAAGKAKAQPVSPVQVLKNGSDREKMWLDDVFFIVSETFRDDEAKVEASESPDKLRARLLRKQGVVLSLSFQFCWSMHLTLKQDSADKWSACRTMIKAHFGTVCNDGPKLLYKRCDMHRMDSEGGPPHQHKPRRTLLSPPCTSPHRASQLHVRAVPIMLQCAGFNHGPRTADRVVAPLRSSFGLGCSDVQCCGTVMHISRFLGILTTNTPNFLSGPCCNELVLLYSRHGSVDAMFAPVRQGFR
jgi:hypothetical protein